MSRLRVKYNDQAPKLNDSPKKPHVQFQENSEVYSQNTLHPLRSRSQSQLKLREAQDINDINNIQLNQYRAIPKNDIYSQAMPSNNLSRIDQENRIKLHLANTEIQELQENLKNAEYALVQTIQEKERVENEKRQNSYFVQELDSKLKLRDREAQDKDYMYRQLQKELLEKDQQQNNILFQTQDRLNVLQREISFREQEINNLRHKIKDRELMCDAALVSDTLNKHNIVKMKEQTDNKDQLIQELQQKLFHTQKQLDQVILSRKSEGTSLLQAEHYKMDNQRLVKLLACTEQFENFQEFATDSLGVRCLDNKREPAVKIEKSLVQSKGKKLNSFKADEESEDWIPQDAFKIAHDFRNKCAGQISVSLMNQFLGDLNKIWRAQQEKKISKIKSDCNKELQFLRRQLQFKKPYEKVIQEAEIKRMRNDLKSAKQSLRENVAVIKQEERGPNTDGLLIIDQTLKYTNEIQMERRKLNQEKEKLQAEVDQLRLEKKDEKLQKEKFYEGATWLGKQSLKVAEDGMQQINKLKMEYHAKITDSQGDEFLRSRAADWLLDSTARTIQDLKDKNQRLMENAIRNNLV